MNNSQEDVNEFILKFLDFIFSHYHNETIAEYFQTELQQKFICANCKFISYAVEKNITTLYLNFDVNKQKENIKDMVLKLEYKNVIN